MTADGYATIWDLYDPDRVRNPRKKIGDNFQNLKWEDAVKQVWSIPVVGGEPGQLTAAKSSIYTYEWHPKGKVIAYTATRAKTEREMLLKEEGFEFTYFEENLKHRNIYLATVNSDGPATKTKQLTKDLTIWAMRYSPDGKTLAVSGSPKNLIDHKYAFSNIYMVNAKSGKITKFSANPGKLGSFEFSPDGKQIVYTAGLMQSDHDVSQVLVQPVKKGAAVNLTVADFKGHVSWANWKDNFTVVYLAGEGAWNTLSTVSSGGGDRTIILKSDRETGVLKAPSFTNDFKHFAMRVTNTDVPYDIYYWNGSEAPERMTTLNPWIADRELGRQEIITYKARDGWEVEGFLYYPVDYEPAKTYPLIVMVHGGPEAHYTWGWQGNYYRPIHTLAGQGFFFFMPNYRSSTGYGLAHTASHLGDAAGVEFDDIADGIDHLIEAGLVDGERVGLGGKSYGGFAAAWFSSYYTEKIKAVMMYVGISDLISKRGTTDIPYEELYVHSGEKLEQMWEQSMKRSPIYYAHQNRTATLIISGAVDTRVHPSQSLEYFRRLKMNDHPATRLVRYPGEPHSFVKFASRLDLLQRSLDWYNWYVKDLRPLDGPMPPLDLGDKYGIDFD